MTREQLHQQNIADLRALLHTREGARFLSRLMDATGVFAISYVPGDSDATAFNEGARNVGLPIYADLMEGNTHTQALLVAAKRERSITDE